MDQRRRLIKVVSHGGHLLVCSLAFCFAILPLLLLADKAMSGPRLTAGNAQEFVKFQHSPLAASPAFAALMEYGLSRVIYAFFSCTIIFDVL